MENQALFNSNLLKEDCCKGDDFSDKELCIDCLKKFKPIQKCCKAFIADPNKDPSKTKQCCTTIPEYKNLPVCLEKCTSETCNLEHCKSTDDCVCQEMIKKQPVDMKDKATKDCFCKLKPDDRQCIDCDKDSTNIVCCEPYLATPKSDFKAYEKCCALFPEQANCKCKAVMSTPTNFEESKLTKCCKDNTVIPDCCDNVRGNPKDFQTSQLTECCKDELFKKLDNDDAGRNACCELKPSMEGCPTPKKCELGKDISKPCCEYYSKNPSSFSEGLKGCCEAKLLETKECCCKNIV